jgi:hypothetical protein
VSTKAKQTKRCAIESTGPDILVWFEGRVIAKRGHYNTPQAGTWIPLEPGVAVYGPDENAILTVEINGVKVH